MSRYTVTATVTTCVAYALPFWLSRYTQTKRLETVPAIPNLPAMSACPAGHRISRGAGLVAAPLRFLLLLGVLLRGCDNLLRLLARDFLVVIHPRLEHAAAAGLGPQHGRVRVELRRRNKCANHLVVSYCFHPRDLASPRGDIAHDVAHAIFGDPHLDVENRLEENRTGFHEPFPECHRPGNLERHFRR